jgi:hypothetical protein
MNAKLISHKKIEITATDNLLFQTEILENSDMNPHFGDTIAEG